MTFFEPPENFNPKFSTACCLIEFKGEILVLQRLSNSSHANQWGMPAGKLDPGEKPEDALVREVKEETGFDIAVSQISLLKKLYMRIPNYDLVLYFYRVTLDTKPEVKISSEHQSFRWATPQEVLKLKYMHDFDECLKIAYPELIK